MGDDLNTYVSGKRSILLCVGTTQGSSEMVPVPPGVMAGVTSASGSIPPRGSVAMITDETTPDIMSDTEKLAASNTVANTTTLKSIKLLNASNLPPI